MRRKRLRSFVAEMASGDDWNWRRLQWKNWRVSMRILFKFWWKLLVFVINHGQCRLFKRSSPQTKPPTLIAIHYPSVALARSNNLKTRRKTNLFYHFHLFQFTLTLLNHQNHSIVSHKSVTTILVWCAIVLKLSSLDLMLASDSDIDSRRQL